MIFLPKNFIGTFNIYLSLALPDVKKLTINPDEDEFMVLACDGIWNFMSSQEVVDFVKARIENSSDKISHICEEVR